jgi:hypothetical protein
MASSENWRVSTTAGEIPLPLHAVWWQLMEPEAWVEPGETQSTFIPLKHYRVCKSTEAGKTVHFLSVKPCVWAKGVFLISALNQEYC